MLTVSAWFPWKKWVNNKNGPKLSLITFYSQNSSACHANIMPNMYPILNFRISRVLASEIKLQVAFASLNGQKGWFFFLVCDKAWELLEERLDQINDIQMFLNSLEYCWFNIQTYTLCLWCIFLINIMLIMKYWFQVCMSLKTERRNAMKKKNFTHAIKMHRVGE